MKLKKLCQERELQQEFYDTRFLLFPCRNQKAKMDEQFSKFVEVIQKLYINIPLLDAIEVPTYAKYLRDILNNKRPLPTTEVIKLMEECSAAILNTSPIKKKDPRCPTIDCSIGRQNFENLGDEDITMLDTPTPWSSLSCNSFPTQLPRHPRIQQTRRHCFGHNFLIRHRNGPFLDVLERG